MQFNPNRRALAPGTLLHWYTIHDVLGQGGFGITYLAHDSNLNQPVAIKEYVPRDLSIRGGDSCVHPLSNAHREDFEWGLRGFLNEARTLSRFDHPHIVRVLAVFEQNSTAYMVMSYEHGASLQEWLPAKVTLEERWLKAMILPLIDGLAGVHEAGFIHRDIKPGNIFIREDDSPVLIDFGAARRAMGAQTRTLTTLVSPGYAPFEQYYARSDRQGPWTDIYGLGATLYRAATGLMPVDALERSESLLNDRADPYVPAAALASEQYSKPFLAAIDHALAFRESERPASLESWARELRGEPNVHGDTAVYSQSVTAAAHRESASTPASGRDAESENLARPRDSWWKWTALGTTMGIVAMLGTEMLYNRAPRTTVASSELAEISQTAVPTADHDTLDGPEETMQRYDPSVDEWEREEVERELDRGWNDLGEMQLTGDGENSAVSRYQRALELSPEHPWALSALSSIFDYFMTRSTRAAENGDYDEALSYLGNALQAAPTEEDRRIARERFEELSS